MTDARHKHGIAIINPYGGIWTDELFETPEAAHEYLKKYWRNIKTDLEGFRLASATATITLDRHMSEPVFIDLPK